MRISLQVLVVIEILKNVANRLMPYFKKVTITSIVGIAALYFAIHALMHVSNCLLVRNQCESVCTAITYCVHDIILL